MSKFNERRSFFFVGRKLIASLASDERQLIVSLVYVTDHLPL